LDDSPRPTQRPRHETPPTNQQALEDQQLTRSREESNRPPRTAYPSRRGAPATRGRRADKLRALRQASAAAEDNEQADTEGGWAEDEADLTNMPEDTPLGHGEQPRVFEDITAKVCTLSEPVKNARKIIMVSS
jgi:hypothetical protein